MVVCNHSCTDKIALMGPQDWWVDPRLERDEWKCVWVVAGVQYVVSIIKKSLGLSALNLDFHQMVCTL